MTPANAALVGLLLGVAWAIGRGIGSALVALGRRLWSLTDGRLMQDFREMYTGLQMPSPSPAKGRVSAALIAFRWATGPRHVMQVTGAVDERAVVKAIERATRRGMLRGVA